MYRIIFFDIDGTLRDECFGVPDTAREAIEVCRENGCYVCLCTGRNKGSIQDEVLALPMDGMIAAGGAYVEFQGSVLKEHCFLEKRMEAVWAYLQTAGEPVAYSFETKDMVYMNEQAANILLVMNREKQKALSHEQRTWATAAEKIQYVDNMKAFVGHTHEVNKICLWAKGNIYERILMLLDVEQTQLAQCTPSGKGSYYEIIQIGCNKGDGVRFLCRHLKFSLKEAMAFGDGQNDIDMLKAVGTAVGMSSGSKEIIPYVDTICEAPKDHGIYLELKRRMVI